MIKYAVFDMDGTLLDTERMFKRSWVDTSERWGLQGANELYSDIVGRSRDTIKTVFEGAYGTGYDFDKFYDERMKCFTELAEGGVPVKPGCFELLEYLRGEGIPYALATSTPMYITGRNLELTGIGKYLDAVVTSEMVEHGKPAPDIFLEAGRRIGANPAECMVVEDSYNGLRGAHAAGMIPVMVYDSVRANDEISKLIYAECDDLYGVLETVKKTNSKI